MKIKKKTGLPYLFMLPSILILLGVYLLPFLYSLYISVTDWSGMGQKLNFVGLSNYKGLFEEPHFWETLRNNLIYFVELVGIQFIISMVLAVVLNAAFKGRNFFSGIVLYAHNHMHAGSGVYLEYYV